MAATPLPVRPNIDFTPTPPAPIFIFAQVLDHIDDYPEADRTKIARFAAKFAGLINHYGYAGGKLRPIKDWSDEFYHHIALLFRQACDLMHELHGEHLEIAKVVALYAATPADIPEPVRTVNAAMDRLVKQKLPRELLEASIVPAMQMLHRIVSAGELAIIEAQGGSTEAASSAEP